MQQIGQQLREARMSKGVSLKTVQEHTKVSMRYLEAIESGNFHVIPGEVYLKGFIRSYARVVGLDSEKLLQSYYQRYAAPTSVQPPQPRSPVARLRQGVLNGVVRSSQRFGG